MRHFRKEVHVPITCAVSLPERKEWKEEEKKKKEKKIILKSKKWAVYRYPVAQPGMDYSVKFSELMRSLYHWSGSTDDPERKWDHPDSREHLKLYPRSLSIGRSWVELRTCSLLESLGAWEGSGYWPFPYQQITRKCVMGFRGNFWVLTSKTPCKGEAAYLYLSFTCKRTYTNPER